MLRRPSWISILGLVALVRCGPPAPPLGAGQAPASVAPDAGHPEHPRGGGHGHGGHGHDGHACGSAQHRFDDAERWSQVFDDPSRDAWQKPDEVIRELGLAPGDVVADLGAGTGYFASRLARAVPLGKVLAIDIEPNLIEHMKRRAEREGTTNVEPILATAADAKLPAGVKVVLVVDTYHHISGRSDYFRRVRARLAPGGRVVIVDFKLGKFPIGPPDDHKLPPETVVSEMASAGYQKCTSFDGLPYQYMLSFGEQC